MHAVESGAPGLAEGFGASLATGASLTLAMDHGVPFALASVGAPASIMTKILGRVPRHPCRGTRLLRNPNPRLCGMLPVQDLVADLQRVVCLMDPILGLGYALRDVLGIGDISSLVCAGGQES